MFFLKISNKFIYQAKGVWSMGFYQKMIEIYQEKKNPIKIVYK